MRILFLLIVVVAVVVGWAAGRPTRPAGSPSAKPATAPISSPTRPTGWPGTVEIARNPNGHYLATGAVNGTPVRFVVDTGASGVALSRTDAARAGIPITDADFTGEARTAGGTIRVAPVRLSRVEIGTIEVRDVPGVVLDVADAMPLLGQSFLGRIDKVSIEGDRMTLTKR